jgi:uncharacterized protein (DUF2141 family)
MPRPLSSAAATRRPVRRKEARLLVAAALAAGLGAPAVRADAPATLVVEVSGARSDRGHVILSLFAGEDGFMRDFSKAIARTSAEVHGGRAHLEVPGLGAGTYAISVFHDENDNGKLDANLIGIPREGVGASNNAKGRMGPPKWKDARFPVAAPRVVQAITLVYL